jgi:lysozyme family protein
MGDIIYPDAFTTGVNRVFAFEGPESNDPTDHGGETKFGITIPFMTEYLGKQAVFDDIHNLTDSVARAVYYKLIWQKFSLGEFAKFTPNISLFFFDWFTTSGGAPAAIQKLLGLVGDGIYGPLTIKAIFAATTTHDFYKKIIVARCAYYVNIVIHDPPQIKYLNGWLARAHYWIEPLG